MKLADLVDLALDVQSRTAAKHPHLAPIDRDREAMRAVLRVAASRIPAIAAHLEGEAPAVVLDELELPRLELRAAPIIEAVAREASAATGGDVTPGLLRAKTGRSWLSPWRQEAWARLARSGMTHEQLGLLFGRDKRAVGRGIEQHEARERAARAVEAVS